jgi:hypothetical protein
MNADFSLQIIRSRSNNFCYSIRSDDARNSSCIYVFQESMVKKIEQPVAGCTSNNAQEFNKTETQTPIYYDNQQETWVFNVPIELRQPAKQLGVGIQPF